MLLKVFRCSYIAIGLYSIATFTILYDSIPSSIPHLRRKVYTELLGNFILSGSDRLGGRRKMPATQLTFHCTPMARSGLALNDSPCDYWEEDLSYYIAIFTCERDL